MHWARRLSRAASWAGILLAALVALTLGLAFLKHPIAGWAYGIPRRSDEPPALGVSLLVVPVVLAAVGMRRLWRALAVDLEGVRQWRKRRAPNQTQ